MVRRGGAWAEPAGGRGQEAEPDLTGCALEFLMPTFFSLFGVAAAPLLKLVPGSDCWEGSVAESSSKSPLTGVSSLGVRGLEVRGLEVRGLEVRGLEVRGMEVRGLEVRDMEIRGRGILLGDSLEPCSSVG